MRHPRRGHSSVKAGSPVFINADQALRSASVSSPCKNQRTTKKRQNALSLIYAGMVEMVDSEDLGSSAVRRVGSSPTTRTKMNTIRVSKFFIETRMVSYSESPAVQGFLLFLCIAYVYRETSKMRRCFYMPALLYEHGFLI